MLKGQFQNVETGGKRTERGEISSEGYISLECKKIPEAQILPLIQLNSKVKVIRKLNSLELPV